MAGALGAVGMVAYGWGVEVPPEDMETTLRERLHTAGGGGEVVRFKSIALDGGGKRLH